MLKDLSAIQLDKNIPIPLYYQLKKQVLNLIESGDLKTGDILPPENELCDLLQISRPTIRQAYGELVAEGYLVRFKGKGTFVAKPKIEDQFLSKLESFEQEMVSKGMKPRTEVLELRKLSGKTDALERLELKLNATVIHLSRLRFADNYPMVFVDTYIPYEPYEGLLDVDFQKNSLYAVLESLYHVRVNRVYREIEAVNAQRHEAELLQIAPNKAIHLVKTVAYAGESPKPVEFSVARYRGDRSKFSVEVSR